MSGIDLSKLPPPDFIALPSIEAIFDEAKAEILNAHPEFEVALSLESEPMSAVLQVVALREYLTRQAVNDAARQCTLAFAQGSNLDHLAAFFGVRRQLIDAGDPAALPPVPEIWETDTDLRERVRLAPRAFSSAGTSASWIYHALTVGQEPIATDIFSPEPGVVTTSRRFTETSIAGKVRDATVQPDGLGQIVVTVLGHNDAPLLDESAINQISAHLNSDEIRQITTSVRVQAASLIEWTLAARLAVKTGPDSSLVKSTAEENLRAYALAQFRLGGQIVRSGLDAALHVPGVDKVELTNWVDIEAGQTEAPQLASFEILVS